MLEKLGEQKLPELESVEQEHLLGQLEHLLGSWNTCWQARISVRELDKRFDQLPLLGGVVARLWNFRSFPVTLSAGNSCFLIKDICERLAVRQPGNRAVASANVQKGLIGII